MIISIFKIRKTTVFCVNKVICHNKKKSRKLCKIFLLLKFKEVLFFSRLNILMISSVNTIKFMKRYKTRYFFFSIGYILASSGRKMLTQNCKNRLRALYISQLFIQHKKFFNNISFFITGNRVINYIDGSFVGLGYF